MSNKVSYIIQLKDRFSRNAEKLRRKFDGVENSVKKANDRMSEFVKTSGGLRGISKSVAKGGAAMSAAVTLPFAVAANKLTKMAADAEEGKAKFNAVFDEISVKANKAAEDYAANFGVAKSTARDMLSGTGDLLSGFGFDDAMSLDISKRVAELGADLAAFQNLEGGAADAADRLTKALLGETESAKALGIVIRQDTAGFRASVKQKALAMRITEQQAKALVVLEDAAKQSANAIGATKREWGGYTSVTKRAGEETISAGEAFGQVLIPVMLKIRLMQEKVAVWFGKLSPVTKKWTVGLAAAAAIIGPLIVLLGALGLAFSFISLPVLAVSAGIAAVVAAVVYLGTKWGSIVDYMTGKWDSFVGKVQNAANSIRRLFGLSVSDYEGPSNRRNPSAPVSSNGRVSGNITVTAEPGAAVKSTQIRNEGQMLDLGLNMKNYGGF